MTYTGWFVLGWTVLALAAPLIGSLLVAGYAFVFFDEQLLSSERASVAGVLVLCLIVIGGGALSEANMQRKQS